MSIDYLNPPEELLDRPIEPWTPKVGDRVRTNLNGECRAVFHNFRYLTRNLNGTKEGHDNTEHGRTGTVELVGKVPTYPPTPSVETHPYVIRFDSPPLSRFGGVLIRARYAACELEPLE